MFRRIRAFLNNPIVDKAIRGMIWGLLFAIGGGLLLIVIVGICLVFGAVPIRYNGRVFELLRLSFAWFCLIGLVGGLYSAFADDLAEKDQRKRTAP